MHTYTAAASASITHPIMGSGHRADAACSFGCCGPGRDGGNQGRESLLAAAVLAPVSGPLCRRLVYPGGTRGDLGKGWPAGTIRRQNLPVASLALLLAPSFFLRMSPGLLPPALFWLAAICNAGAAALLAVHLWQLWRRRSFLPQVSWPGAGCPGSQRHYCLCAPGPGFWAWSAGGQLRIFYLHDLLLGWVSTMLIGLLATDRFALSGNLRRAVNWLWVTGVLVMLGAAR